MDSVCCVCVAVATNWQVQFRKTPVEGDVDVSYLADETDMFSGAEVRARKVLTVILLKLSLSLSLSLSLFLCVLCVCVPLSLSLSLSLSLLPTCRWFLCVVRLLCVPCGRERILRR